MAKIDRETLKAVIRDHTETLCQHYFPDGKRIGKQWVIGNINGECGQSLRIELEGEKTGLVYDFATAEGCDFLDAVKRKTGLRFLEVAREIGQIAAVSVEEPTTQSTTSRKGGRYQTSSSTKPFEWDKTYGHELSPGRIDEVCRWRGLTQAYVVWTNEHRYFGCTKNGHWAFPVYWDGKIVSAQVRIDKNTWRYEPKLKDLGIPLSPQIIGDLATGEKAFLVESTWDNFAVLDKLGIQHGEPIAGIATRGASNARLIAAVEFRAAVEIYIIPQNDDPGQNWAQSIGTTLNREFKVIRVPIQFHDVNDWLKALGNN